MKYFIGEFKLRLAAAVADILEVDSSEVEVENANEKVGAELAVPVFKFAGAQKQAPNKIAEDVAGKLKLTEAEKVEAAGGFVNIWLKPSVLAHELSKQDLNKYGQNDLYAKQDVIIEHTDPNPFKQIHIGHVYSNTVGESLARLHEAAGAKVHRVSYHGDVGVHVAKAMWGIQKNLKGKPITSVKDEERSAFLGKAYADGAKAYEDDDTAQDEINELNKAIYAGKDEDLKTTYEIGRKWSFEYFDSIYARLQVPFEKQYFESDAAVIGEKIVAEHTPGVFESSKGATIFKGEEFNLHTRVFINSDHIPTYEAKDLGLMKLKAADYPKATLSIIITAEEQAAYFKVMLKAMEQIDPDLAGMTKHLSHGEVRLPSGKMSSRTGDVITAVELLDLVYRTIEEKAPDSPAKTDNMLSGIKYSFLKQNIGGNVVYDVEDSISLEGQSGPYVQYAAVRAGAITKKVHDDADADKDYDYEAEKELLWLITRYPEEVYEATAELEPHRVAQFIYELARALNRYYEKVNVKESADGVRAARLQLMAACRQILENGLGLLNIPTPRQM